MFRSKKCKTFFVSILLLLVSSCNSENSVTKKNITTFISNGLVASCDVVLDKQYYEICYDNDLKGPHFVAYMLFADNVDSGNIKTKPSFYKDSSLPIEFASKSSDYTGSGFDRGHLADDASFDWSENSLKSTYVMSNIIPQYPSVNRYAWIDTEKKERFLAKKYGEVGVIIGIIYDNNYQRIGADNIAVPTAFYKSIFNKEGNQVCYYYKNIPIVDASSDILEDHEIDCLTLTLKFNGMSKISFPIHKNIIEKPSYSCQTNKTCTQMSSCIEAYFYLNNCGVIKLDRDHDGIPCENICK